MTWEELIGADRTVLEELMRTGATPDPRELMGHTYRGLNRGWVTRMTGRRFKKVFHEQDGQPFGHNIVERRGKPVEIGWFSLRPEGHTVRFDYNVSQNRGVNFPLRGIQDLTVLPNPGNHGLLLGRARFMGCGSPTSCFSAKWSSTAARRSSRRRSAGSRSQSGFST